MKHPLRITLLLLFFLSSVPLCVHAAVTHENGFAQLSFANGKQVSGEVRQSTAEGFVLDSPEGTVELRWDQVTARTSISPFEYLTQRALDTLAAGDEPGALALAQRAVVLEQGKPLPAPLQALIDDRRREAMAVPSQEKESAVASAEYLLKEQNYQGVIDVVTSATLERTATPELLALGIEAEYNHHLQELEPTVTFHSKFAPLLEGMQPDHPMLIWLDTRLKNARQQQVADANKPDLIDHIAAEKKRVQDLELAYEAVQEQIAAERIAYANAYNLSRYNAYGASRYGGYVPYNGYRSGTALGSRYGDLYRNYNYNSPNVVWVDDATRLYSDAPNAYFRNGGRPMTLEYALRNHYSPAGADYAR